MPSRREPNALRDEEAHTQAPVGTQALQIGRCKREHADHAESARSAHLALRMQREGGDALERVTRHVLSALDTVGRGQRD